MSDTGKAIIAKLTNVQAIPGADRIVQAEVLGEAVIVGAKHKDDELGIFFPAGLCVSKEFALENKLYRKHPDTEEAMGGYLESNGRIKFTKMRGVVSRGLWLPKSSVAHFNLPSSFWMQGMELSDINGQEICYKYISPEARIADNIAKNKKGKPKSPKYVNFYKIGDTSRMVYNLHALKPNKHVVVTEKLHGTSGRSGYMQVRRDKNIIDSILDFFGIVRPPKYKDVVGTRRMIVTDSSPNRDARIDIHERLTPFLKKGQIVYYEIVGFEKSGASIMPYHTVDDKPMYYSYGNQRSSARPYSFYIYKIIEHTEEGEPIVYSWEQLVAWCEQRDLQHVPMIHHFVTRSEITDEFKRTFLEYIKEESDGLSTLDQNHIREGICVIIDGKTYKHKGNKFCIAEDINPYSPEDDA